MEEKKSCSNTHECECTSSCERHARCCDCVAYHKALGNLPVCLRPKAK